MKLKLLKLAKPMIIPLWAIIDKLFDLHGLVGVAVNDAALPLLALGGGKALVVLRGATAQAGVS